MTNAEKFARMREALANQNPDLQAILSCLVEIVRERVFPPGPSVGAPLQPGDVVRLRSGGPAWTALHLAKDADTWHVARHREDPFGVSRDVFPAAALVRVDGEGEPAKDGRLGDMTEDM